MNSPLGWDAAADDPRYGLGYAFVAYAFLIVAFFAYTAWIHVRCERLRRRLREVEQRLDEVGASRRG